MAIVESVKKIFSKVLSIGTPSEDDVLYSKIIKKKISKESAEKLTLKGIKETVTHLFHHDDTSSEEITEFSRGTPTPQAIKSAPAQKTAKKKPAPKKTSTKTAKTSTKKAPAKKTSTKKTSTKETITKTVSKKPAAKKTATKKTTAKTTEETKTAVKKTTIKKAPEKKPVAKKPVAKKTVSKKASEKKPATKSTTTQKQTAPKGGKRAEKIALYIKDIKKHYGEVDEDFVAIIVKNLGPSIYKKDAELVSCSDPKELDTVRKNFLMKKLGIDASRGVLDAAIADVCQELKSTRTKYRATFYYALAKKFKKESVLS